tara:strand:- start:354 stop:776 length:423 start_codon:yes stop_codon:yes gene_type:complete
MGPDGQMYSPHPEAMGDYNPDIGWLNWEHLLTPPTPPDSLTPLPGMFYPERPEPGQGQTSPGWWGETIPEDQRGGWGRQPAFDPTPQFQWGFEPKGPTPEETGSLDYWIGQQLPTQSGYQQGLLPDLPSLIGQNPTIFFQ